MTRVPLYWKENFFNVFNNEKATAALTAFISLKGNVADFYYLNKMMYLLERKSILETGMPVFFDRLCSLPYGPVPSNVNDELKNVRQMWDFADWAPYVRFNGQTTVELIQEADYDYLSRYELRSIQQLHKEIEDTLHLSKREPSDAFNTLHSYVMKLPEYVKKDAGREYLPYEDLLIKNGVDPIRAQKIQDEIDFQTLLTIGIKADAA